MPNGGKLPNREFYAFLIIGTLCLIIWVVADWFPPVTRDAIGYLQYLVPLFYGMAFGIPIGSSAGR